MLDDLRRDIDKLLSANNTTYLTHNFHPYAAKFIPQIPQTIINKFSNNNETIMDPFCGSGTALVEAKILGRKGIGIDLHPIAALCSKVKTTKIDEKSLNKVEKILAQIENDILKLYKKDPNMLTHYLDEDKGSLVSFKLLEFKNRDHWFQLNVLQEISIIKNHIEKITDINLADLLKLALSAIIVRVSNQESETRYAAKNKNIDNLFTFNLFKNKIVRMKERLLEFNTLATDEEIEIFKFDSRYIDFIKPNSVDLIVTSPPYPNTYDYYLYHKFRMLILDHDVSIVRENEIGSRNKHSSQERDISDFITDMILCFKQFNRILKSSKYMVIIIGDSIIRKELIDGLEITNQIANKSNFEFVDNISYSLNIVSKTFNKAFRSTKKKEHIILYKNKK